MESSRKADAAWVESRVVGPTGWEKAKKAVRGLPALLPRLTLLSALSSLTRDGIVADVSAGIVVAIMLIPQALAYAQLAGAPLITGYYTSILSTAVYPLFGTSASLAVGPVAIMSLLSQEGVAHIVDEKGGGPNPARFMELVSRRSCAPEGKTTAACTRAAVRTTVGASPPRPRPERETPADCTRRCGLWSGGTAHL